MLHGTAKKKKKIIKKKILAQNMQRPKKKKKNMQRPKLSCMRRQETFLSLNQKLRRSTPNIEEETTDGLSFSKPVAQQWSS